MTSALSFGPPAIALVRAVPASFGDALRGDPVPLDVQRARRQHAAYVEALRTSGVEVVELPVADALPDSVFVEDPVVALDRVALRARSAAPSRRPEAASVVEVLSGYRRIVEMRDEGATFDGGDVLRLRDRLLVGASSRTNDAGIAELERVGASDGLRVGRVEVQAGLHLKSAVTLAQPGWALVDARGVDPAAIASLGLDVTEVEEPLGANVLCLGAVTLVSTAAPRTAALVRARGQRVIELELDELHKADGALTCCSVRLAADGQWCA